ncbi:unnamed protein product [Orchesella dallaii]|uniref:protein-serine/threonine phosphatase n=1 Tax=Orchesella dallaii TaxID=48710 RepID=A0ABP1RL17_9HEXA
MPEIEKHLHQLHHLLREQDSIKLVVRLENLTATSARSRYLAVVSCVEQECEEYCVLGIDCEKSISLGLVLAILSHTTIRLDGDGGFSITNGDGLRSHIFKPVSVQTMWTALQSLYQASECAKKNNSYQVYAVNHYNKLFQTYTSETACLNEWNALPGVEVRRPMTSQMTSEEITLKEKISSALREILLNEKDLDEVTSKEIRTKLETKLQIDFTNYKSFIDEEMLRILGQMEAPALIVDHLYLGTEWNASHQQELSEKEISCILNVTAEIDNFFPDMFRYMNIPVIDNEETDLLRYFNDSYRFISQALKEEKNVLVHCKMGISRSATIVIAYVMKTRNWDLPRSLEHVKKRRTCVKPNPHFMKQLEVYEGILAAKRYSSTLEKRSKSESNLKQSDIALSTPKERNFSSSNNDIIISGNEVKSPRKYYNTAPARLKPEKSGKICGDLLRPKSCSCATISMSSKTPFNDIVPPEVMDSFTEAVRSLEQQSLPPDCRLNCPDTPPQKHENHVEVPIVKIFDDSQSDCNMDTEESETPVPESMMETPSPVELPEEVPDGLNVKPLELNILPTLEEKPDDPKSPTSQDSDSSSRKNISLKCCRKPFNGHTFSVSPNQVINISTILDSKFSVRRLVNEFESQSNRQLNSLLASIPDSNNTVNMEQTSPTSITRSSSRVKSWVMNDAETNNSAGEDNQDNGSTQSSSYESDANSSGDDRVSKKPEGLGCLSFLKLRSSHSHFKDRFPKETSSLIDTSKSFRKSGDSPCRSRDKLKEKTYKSKIKWPMDVFSNKMKENENNKPEFHHMKTGVVKQRLEAFEAKSTIPLSKQQYFIRSHSRSHSATGTSTTYPYDSIEPLSYGHQRKSSLPQLNNSTDFDSSSLPHRFPIVSLPDRKGSLDSNVFRTFPNANCRSFTVRGFQSNSKSLFSSSRSKSNNVGCNPPSSGSRQQHGSTHPLTHLPTTYLS